MKITIDYNGAFAVCNIEPMEEPGKMVNFNEADIKSQTFALGAFDCIKQHWKREQQQKREQNLPVIHIIEEYQILPKHFNLFNRLMGEGVIISAKYETGYNVPHIELRLSDNHTVLETGAWLIHDPEGRWWGMDNDYHKRLASLNKIKIVK